MVEPNFGDHRAHLERTGTAAVVIDRRSPAEP
jgi:hypothetical protein